MAEVTSLLSPVRDSNILAVQAFKGLHLEPPTKDVVEIDGNAEPVTKEEEVVTKKKTELTTTRQIETRVKRQVVLEDGKVVQDSGPIVETNTTEDTDKQESETTERRKLGDDAVDKPEALQNAPVHGALANISSGLVRAVVSRPDGLVREVKTKTVVSREEIDERLETEDVKFLGDFSDEAYVDAVNSGKDIKSTLLSGQRQLAPVGPRVIHQSTNAHKTVDTEDVDLKCLAQPDGTLITEKKKTTEHEELFDEDLPEKDDNSTGSRERVDQKEASQRFYKQRDEQAVEYVANGKVIGKEIKYAAETEQMDKDLHGPMENPSDWDSLSDRLRKTRRNQKTLLQQHREALLGDRKDALTERPLDFDKEELTRKGETIKWLESHFGSESRSSKDSRDDDVEPTKKSFFNVTIKSNATTPTTGTAKPFPSPGYERNVTAFSNVVVPERENNPKNKFFQGISEWSERKDSSPNNFPSKRFQEELKGTLERNRNRHRVGSREELRPNRLMKDEVDFKRNGRSGSRGDLRYRCDSNGGSDDSRNLKAQKEDLGYLSARNDSKEELYAKSTKKQNGYLHREDSGYVKDSREDIGYLKNGREDSFIRDSGEDEKNYKDVNKSIIQRDDSAYVSSSTYFTAPRSPLPPQKMRTPDSGIRSPSPDNYDSEDVRPTVPQRKRALEKKLRLTHNEYSQNQKNDEPSPDYSPPSRSRSISPPTTLSQQLNGGMKKYQRTRFASETPRPTSTQTNHTQPASPPSKQNKVSTVIGNSLRKLVGKIRSASAERKMKMKSKRSPSPTTKLQQHQQSMTNGASTYQQYNVIDSHIGQSNREASVVSDSRRERTIDRRGSSDVDMASPKQKYYLGEDPYGGSIYGKENRYDGVRPQRNNSRRLRSENVELYSPPKTLASSNYTASQTLGRFSKSTNRLATTTPTVHDYRSTQTLPRKLEHKPVHHSSTINVSIVNAVKPTQNTGPAKPARTYKALNRSKSFNVHGLNGTNDPSPIYMEKLNKNFSQSLYKSNPHLNEDKPQLKSPSIVNLVSRSQKDLTKIDEDLPYSSERRLDGVSYSRQNGYSNGVSDKRNVFLRGLQDQAPELFKTLHGDEDIIKNGQVYKYNVDRNVNRERESSLGSRSPITINKDTASIVRRGSSSTEDYSETYKISSKSDDPNRPGITNTVHSFTKKTIPMKHGRGTETIESSERKTVTTSRYKGEPMSNMKYMEERGRRGSSGPIVIENRLRLANLEICAAFAAAEPTNEQTHTSSTLKPVP